MISLGTDFDTVLTRAAVVVLAAAAAWALLVVASLAAEARSRGRVRLAERLGCPRVVRAWLLGLFLAVFGGVVPAQAHDAGPGSAIDTALDGLPLPDRAVGGVRATTAPAPYDVVVRAGDSLWRIARDRLPRRASPADVAATVARVYAANRPTIGPDPDLLTPGEHLRLPTDLSDHRPVPTTSPEAP